MTESLSRMPKVISNVLTRRTHLMQIMDFGTCRAKTMCGELIAFDRHVSFSITELCAECFPTHIRHVS